MEHRRWYMLLPWIGFIVALVLRLWNVGVPAQIVSDEFSFVNEGRYYLSQQDYFDTHPPLGKMEIGVAIGLFSDHPVVWRIVSAVSGALIIPLLWWIVWRLTRRRVAAAIVAVLAILDGLLLVDSRLGLINIPYILPSLLAFATILKAINARRPILWLLMGGIFIGVAVATKWLALLAILPAIWIWFWPGFFGLQRNGEQQRPVWWSVFGAFVIVPFFVYWLVFAIHFAWLGIPSEFWALNLQMLNYHLSVPSTGDPKQQPWLGWLLAWRPFPYWTDIQGHNISVLRSLPNPWIWWTGSALVLACLLRGWRLNLGRLLNVFILCAWIPFAFIQRIMYSYHALLLDVWLLVLLSLTLDRLWDRHRRAVMVYLVIGLAVFVWFAPWYLNIPLSPAQHKLRQWLPTWAIQE